MKDDYKSKGYVGRDVPLEREDMTRKKDPTIDVYFDGTPCGDMEAKPMPGGFGGGPVVGGEPMGIHHKFANGIPNEGREDISAERMLPEHKKNINEKVFSPVAGTTHDDDGCADKSVIRPVNMGVHNTFGIK